MDGPRRSKAPIIDLPQELHHRAAVWGGIKTPSKTGAGGFMNGIIYLVGLIVIVMAILSFIGLR